MPTPTVALVLVSHSRALAEGTAELAGQMAPDVTLLPAGGMDDGGLGTGFQRVLDALETALDDGRSAVVLTDLGSAVLTAESVLEVLEPEAAARVRLADAPFVEGAVEAAVAAQGGQDVDAVLAAARRAAAAFGPGDAGTDGAEAGATETRSSAGDPRGDAGRAPTAQRSAEEARDAGLAGGAGHAGRGGHAGQAGDGAAAQDAGGDVPAGGGTPQGAESLTSDGAVGTGHPGVATAGTDGAHPAGDEPTARGTAVLRNRLGLHARPAASIARTASAFQSRIAINGADAKSVLALVALGAVGGTEVAVTAAGPDARTAVNAVVAELEEGFGEA